MLNCFKIQCHLHQGSNAVRQIHIQRSICLPCFSLFYQEHGAIYSMIETNVCLILSSNIDDAYAYEDRSESEQSIRQNCRKFPTSHMFQEWVSPLTHFQWRLKKNMIALLILNLGISSVALLCQQQFLR